MKNRRCIVIQVSPDHVVALLGGWKRHSTLMLPWICQASNAAGERVDFPADMEVLEVNYDWYARSFQFRMTHPSFAEVPDGHASPLFAAGSVWVNVVDINSGSGGCDDPFIVERPTN